MHLLVGLGNPGARYVDNRHNIGFLAVEEIARRHNFGPWRKNFQGEISEGRLGREKILLLKPQTYMNESGRSAGEALRFYKLDPEAVTVFYDEIDLAPGKVKVKRGGGAAGHNGVRSLIAHVGPEFQRVRLGVGHPGRKDLVHHYVLSDFAKADDAWLDPLLESVADNAELLLSDEEGEEAEKARGLFMSRVALAVNPGRAKDEQKIKTDDD